MRTPPLGEPVGRREIEAFGPLAGRPLVIVGEAPLDRPPPYAQLPAGAVVFRAGRFTDEPAHFFGNRVEAWFEGLADEAVEKAVARAARTGRYEVARLCAAHRIPSWRDGEEWGDPFIGLAIPEYDPFAVIAQVPRLARQLMGPVLPGAAFQALAFALGVGFRRIVLTGMGMGLGDSGLGPRPHRPGARINPRRSLAADADLAFLQAALASFPEADVALAGEEPVLAAHLPQAPELPAGDRMSGTNGDCPRLSHLQGGARRGRDPLPPLRPKPEPPPGVAVSATVGGRACAYVTLVSGPTFHHGARALAGSLRRVTDVPLVALATPDANTDALEASGIAVVGVAPIANPGAASAAGRAALKVRGQSRFTATYTKLWAFGLDFLDRFVYVDADAVVLKSLDVLFEEDGFAAALDAGIDLADGSVFNSGAFAASPSPELFAEMIAELPHLPSYDGGDQGFLNAFFSQPGRTWVRLPQELNTTKRIFAHHPAVFREDDVAVLHYVGTKPWAPGGSGRYEELAARWLNFLDPRELRELVTDLRLEAAKRSPWAQRGRELAGFGARIAAVRSAADLAAAARQGTRLVTGSKIGQRLGGAFGAGGGR